MRHARPSDVRAATAIAAGDGQGRAHRYHPFALLSSISSHRGLIVALVRRSFVGRYKGSLLGLAWSMFHPLLMLATYTFVFGVAFGARADQWQDATINLGIVLFSGLIVHGVFAECLNAAPALITNQPSYVKKVVFPIEILAVVAVCAALLHFLVNLALLWLFCLLSGTGEISGILIVPIAILPLILQMLGISWLLASLGTYLRDVGHATGVLTTILMFLSPVFYPRSALPADYQGLLSLNPITLPIEQIRGALLWNSALDWASWVANLSIGLVVLWLGFWWFQKSRVGFADVL